MQKKLIGSISTPKCPHMNDDGDEYYDEQFNKDDADGVYQDWL